MDYLGNFKFVIYMSEEAFDQETYGEGAIQKRSRFWTRQID